MILEFKITIPEEALRYYLDEVGHDLDLLAGDIQAILEDNFYKECKVEAITKNKKVDDLDDPIFKEKLAQTWDG